MRRRLMVLVAAGLVAACAYVVALGVNGSGDGSADAVVMPYPRTLKPLPVPEVRIGQGPWADPLPSPSMPGAPELLTCRTVDGSFVQKGAGQERSALPHQVCQHR